jgi:hypothetical protein
MQHGVSALGLAWRALALLGAAMQARVGPRRVGRGRARSRKTQRGIFDRDDVCSGLVQPTGDSGNFESSPDLRSIDERHFQLCNEHESR